MDFVGTFTYTVNGHDVHVQTSGEADYKKKEAHLNKMGYPWTYESTADCRTRCRKEDSGRSDTFLASLGINTPEEWDAMDPEARDRWMALGLKQIRQKVTRRRYAVGGSSL